MNESIKSSHDNFFLSFNKYLSIKLNIFSVVFFENLFIPKISLFKTGLIKNL